MVISECCAGHLLQLSGPHFKRNLPLQLNTQHFLKDALVQHSYADGIAGIWQKPAVAGCGICDRPPTHPTPQPLARLKSSTPPGCYAPPRPSPPEAIAAIANSVQGVTRCMSIRSRGMVGRQVWVELRLAISS